MARCGRRSRAQKWPVAASFAATLVSPRYYPIAERGNSSKPVLICPLQHAKWAVDASGRPGCGARLRTAAQPVRLLLALAKRQQVVYVWCVCLSQAEVAQRGCLGTLAGSGTPAPIAAPTTAVNRLPSRNGAARCSLLAATTQQRSPRRAAASFLACARRVLCNPPPLFAWRAAWASLAPPPSRRAIHFHPPRRRARRQTLDASPSAAAPPRLALWARY
ncbi:hypothetical protein BDV95DRAFT_68677 [Massariosphaeria phaeospora]|uniref:Uncharacterized protein n=1 Tax=Massariosphaeria phaeospora TaxID=100035 RepID=A0A7C8MAY4_9PLEO|nr:hypothetical protein BDV95DRAFT_68677 [Massariosphaeria phaeospora]